MSATWVDLLYLLCFLTSLSCCLLLIRSYRRNRSRVLLWTAACFVLLAIDNLLVVLDLIVLPNVDLSLARLLATLFAVSTLLVGFVGEFV
ncbi:MAG TPA: DUF5985 family protein [Xanthobacteraceae bacterium]|jgi:Family of unknown function (DUF5985)|nr:DUF5985 family protein [Xanthobacteraceae bacterium]